MKKNLNNKSGYAWINDSVASNITNDYNNPKNIQPYTGNISLDKSSYSNSSIRKSLTYVINRSE